MRNRIKNTVCTLLFITLSVTTVLLIYLHFFASEERNLSGEWIAGLDMTEQASARALVWLEDIEAVSISLEELESYMRNLTIQVNMTLEQTAPSEGTFQCHILPESYEECSQAAYEALARAFHALLTERLYMAGYGDGMEGEKVEALVTETFGMSTVSYLRTCGPALLPSLEELQAQYEGSGTYEAADGIMTRMVHEGEAVTTIKESYIRKEETLILTEERAESAQESFLRHSPMIYTLQSQSP